MELNDQQKKMLAQWVAEKRSLGEIQKLIAQEFKISMTYMDVRFLLIDLGLSLKDAAPKPTARHDLAAPAHPAQDDGFDEADDTLAPPGGKGGVSISIDKVLKPGALVSGTVTFSDGVTAGWMLDQLGRLAIEARKPGYRPSQKDLQAFQMELSRELQKRGF